MTDCEIALQLIEAGAGSYLEVVRIENVLACMLFDSGAKITLIPKKVFEKGL